MGVNVKKVIAALVIAVGSLMVLPAWADSRDFDLVNATGYPIKHVFIDQSSSDEWTDDILGRDILDNGETVSITFGQAEKGCKWDLKVIYTDDESAVWSGFNLCVINSITLKWNKNTGVTTAVVK